MVGKALFSALIFLLPISTLAIQRAPFSTDKCIGYFPFGFPKSGNANSTFICREGYALEYDIHAKIPTWVSYTLTPSKAVGCSKRESYFTKDVSLDKKNAASTLSFKNSGYDIGHMANSADMRWNDLVSSESNILTNAAPQKPALNRGPWKQLENLIRAYVLETGNTVLIYVGPIKTYGAKTIGVDRIVVPDKFFKVVVDLDKNFVISFVYPQTATAGHPDQFITSIQDVMSQAKVFLPTNDLAKQLAKFPEISKKSIISQKKEVCIQ